jgi:hypothetical protein
MKRNDASLIAQRGSSGVCFLFRTFLTLVKLLRMVVYHFTLHAYRSWSPAHPRGYAQHGKGYQPTDRDKAEEYDGRAKFPKVVFDHEIQEILILGAYDICQRRGWRLHAVGTDPSHVQSCETYVGK